jgi:hypothetical protein
MSSLKNEARRFFEKPAHPLFFESPLKLQRHLDRLLAIWKQIANGAYMSAFYYIQLLATTLDQIWNLFATTQ